MQVLWHGAGGFSFVVKTPSAGEVTVLLDPPIHPRTKVPAATLVVYTHGGKDVLSGKEIVAEHPETRPDPFVIDHPGEYEVGGVMVRAIWAPRSDGTPQMIAAILVEGMRVGALGALDRALTTAELDLLGPIDIALIPVGGGSVLAASAAADVVTAMEPRVVVPSYLDATEDDVAAVADRAVRAMGLQKEAVSKWKVTRAQLPEEDAQIVVIA